MIFIVNYILLSKKKNDFFTQHRSIYLNVTKDVSKTHQMEGYEGSNLKDTEDTVVNSLGIISFVSFFIGGVITIQLALSTTGSFYPDYLVGYATRETIILEFAPTIISIIMAGKVGSFITSSIGSMRVTEQIDALEVMGINSINYLVFPKVIALLLYPFLISIAMFLGILGGMVACVYGGYSTMSCLLYTSDAADE